MILYKQFLIVYYGLILNIGVLINDECLISSFLIDEKEYHKFLEKQISGREKRKQVNISLVYRLYTKFNST